MLLNHTKSRSIFMNGSLSAEYFYIKKKFALFYSAFNVKILLYFMKTYS